MTRRYTGNKLVLIVPIIAVVSSIALIWYGSIMHRAFRETLIYQFQQLESEVVRSSANSIETLFTRLTNDILALANTPHLQDPQDPIGQDYIREFYKSNQDIVFAGYRMDNSGVLVYMYPVHENAMNADISYQDHVVKLFGTKRLVVSGLFRSVEGFDSIAIHAPVFKDREMNGSVATMVIMKKITDRFLKDTSAGSNGYAWMVDEDGIILYHPEESLVGMKITDTNLFTEEAREDLVLNVWRGKSRTMQIGDTLFAIEPLKIGGRLCMVVLSTPYSDISTPINEHWRSTWMLTTGVLLLMSIGGFVIVISGIRAAQLAREKSLLEEKVGLESELLKSRDRLDIIIKTIPSGLFTVDRNCTIRSWNNTAERITGYGADEVIGRRCHEIMGGYCAIRCALFDPDEMDDKPIVGRECVISTRDGRSIVISKNSDYLRDLDGMITGGIESFIDITEEKRAEEERINAISLENEIEHLRRMDEVKTNFLSMVSHELRTPLSVMLGNLSMAEKEKYGRLPERFRERLKVIMKRGWQLNDLIDNLLDLARIESGRVELKKQIVGVPTAAEEAIGEHRDEIEKKKLNVEKHFADDAREVVVDGAMFRRLLTNLVGNAVKFTPEGGAVRLTSYREERAVAISVKDTGIGIPRDEQTKIFDRFYQVDNSSTRQFGGTGLGLAIVKEIAEVHKADIRVDSREGEGTVITVLFPDSETGGEEFQISHIDAGGQTLLPDELRSKSGVLLLVDNDPETLTARTDLVEGSGIRVLYVETISEARMLIDSEPVSLILLNPADMDETSGFLAGMESENTRVPVALVTNDRDAAKGLENEFVSVAVVFQKPVSMRLVIQLLAGLLP